MIYMYMCTRVHTGLCNSSSIIFAQLFIVLMNRAANGWPYSVMG